MEIIKTCKVLSNFKFSAQSCPAILILWLVPKEPRKLQSSCCSYKPKKKLRGVWQFQHKMVGIRICSLQAAFCDLRPTKMRLWCLSDDVAINIYRRDTNMAYMEDELCKCWYIFKYLWQQSCFEQYFTINLDSTSKKRRKI